MSESIFETVWIKTSNDELCVDELSDCSDENYMDTSDDEFTDNDSEPDDTINSGDTDWFETDIRPKLETYDRTSGVNTIPQNQENILEIVQLFLGDDLFELFVTETNRYHSQFEKIRKQNKKPQWVDVTVLEMKKFLGLIILMGQVRKDDLHDYWSTLLYIETPIFTKTMSRNRFMQIWRMWHFCNNDLLVDKSDKLFKIREVLNYLQYKFQTVYTPKRELTLDEEGVIPGGGGLSFRYNPMKVVKNGILVRLLCESASGYICNFKVYASRTAMLQDTVLPILDPYAGFHHHIYLNNYYNSVEIAEFLLQKNTRICGTIKANRGFPESLKNLTLKQRETKFVRKGEILLQIWQSKKNQKIKTISTIHSADMVTVRHGTGPKIKPKSVAEYTKYIKLIDRADLYMSYYNILRSRTKWTKKAVIYFLNTALFNSFQVHKKINNNKWTYKRFLRQVAIALIEAKETQNLDSKDTSYVIKVTKRAPTHDPPGRLSQDFQKHKLVKIVSRGNRIHRKCRVCVANKKNWSTKYVCEYCNVPLHEVECFERYHTLKEY